ncbi:unnamed protein product, partial [Meganyctiphanes norvegica]
MVTQRKQMLHSWSVKNLYPDTAQGFLKALKEKNGVYVEMVIKNEKRHAKLSQLEKSFIFHPFTKQTVTDGSKCMPFDRFQKEISEDASLVFLELTLGDTIKGCIKVRLDKNLPNTSEHIVHIVTGHRGPSMKGIGLCKSKTIGLCNTSLPFSGIRFTHDSSRRSIAKTGDLIGFFPNGYLQYLYIHVDAQPNTFDFSIMANPYWVFGHVEEGFDILQVCYDNYKKGIKISDCG